MVTNIIGVHHQLVFQLPIPSHPPCCFPKLSADGFGKKSPFFFKLDSHYKAPVLHFIPKAAASSPSLGGSGAQQSEQLLGEIPQMKRQTIAGVNQDELLDPALLADPDSCFCEFNGVNIHHKMCDAESDDQNLPQEGTAKLPSQTIKINFPMILLHGFGASIFSWNRVMKTLAQVTGSKVLGFDRPAFGLTSRPIVLQQSSHGSKDIKPLNPYSTTYSVMATLFFIDFLAAEKAIVVGHSAGSLVAVETYFEAPERVAALILVAPAIFAPLSVRKLDEENQQKGNDPTQADSATSDLHSNTFMRVYGILSKFFLSILHAIMRLVKGMANMLNSLYKNALCAILRSAIGVMLVRMIIDKFGIPAVRNSWYDSNQVPDYVLQGYTKPLRVKDWDKALVEYTAAMLADPVSESKPPLGRRLSKISCPVLIVTGDKDRLVPAWNSKRLSKAIPGSCFEVIKNCGHLPHEERTEEFVSVVQKFLQSVFGGLEVQQLQPAA